MYVAALEALGLEPDAVIGVNLSSKWIGITLAESDQTGRPIVTLGQLTPRQINIELSEDASADSAGGEDAPGDADEEGGAEVVDDADQEGDAEIADDADQEDEDDGDAPVDPAPPLEDDEVLS